MTGPDANRLEDARKALEDLSHGYKGPHPLQADLDFLASRLRKLPSRLTKVTFDPDVFALRDIIDHYAAKNLVSAKAAEACLNLEELADLADYDMPFEEEEFSENVAEQIDVLGDELTKLFTKIEDEAG
jgi:hypothetical protein